MYVYLLIYISRYVVELSYILGNLFNNFFFFKTNGKLFSCFVVICIFTFGTSSQSIHFNVGSTILLFFLAIYSQKKKKLINRNISEVGGL